MNFKFDQLKFILILSSLFFKCNFSFAQDTTSYIYPSIKAKNFYIGVLIYPPAGANLSKSSGIGKVFILLTGADLFAEYYLLNSVSLFTSLTYKYEYYKYIQNKGSIAGTATLRYHFPLKFIDMPEGFFWHLGLGYTNGYYYNTPNIKTADYKIESFGLDIGASYLPTKVFNKQNSRLVLECTIINPIFRLKKNIQQASGGFGIKYKF